MAGCSQSSHIVAAERLQVAWPCCSYICPLIPSLMLFFFALYRIDPFSRLLNLVLSHITILVVLACGCKASLVLKQLFGRAITVLSAENRLRGKVRFQSALGGCRTERGAEAMVFALALHFKPAANNEGNFGGDSLRFQEVF